MNVAAVVPMKGHSERVPHKNIRTVGGRRLFEWVIDSLLEARTVSRVLVDTDSDEIADLVTARHPDIEIRMRPDALRGDLVPMHDIVADVADELDADLVLQTHATNPLLTAPTIDRAVDVFTGQTEHDSLMSVTEWRTRFFWPDGRPLNHDPAQLGRTQDLAPILEENSNLYLAPRELIVTTRRRVGANPLLFRVDAAEAVDIDDEFDLVVAEALLEARRA